MKKWMPLMFAVVLMCVLSLGISVRAEEYTVPEAYVVLDDDDTVAWSLQQDLYVDLDGYSLMGTIITNGYKIYGMDSSTDSYEVDNSGTFCCVDENGAPVVPEPYVKTDLSGQVKRYMTVWENEFYTFQRMYLGITNICLAPADTGVGFKAEFYGCPAVLQQVQSVGYRLWLAEGNPISRTADGFRQSLSLRLKNFDAVLYGQTPVYATVFVTMADGTVLETAEHSVTLRGAVESVNKNAGAYSDVQLDAVLVMLQAHPVMQTWDVGNLLRGKLFENTAYHLRMEQNTLGQMLYMTGGMDDEYWATTTDEAYAANVYAESAGEGYRFYYYDSSNHKSYIQAYMKSTSSSRPQASATPSQVWYYNETLGVFTVTMNGAEYYMGTYSNYSTIGVSNVKYISGNNAANVGLSQFVAEFVLADLVEEEQPGGDVGGDDIGGGDIGGDLGGTDCQNHIDGNNDGYCDQCNTYVIVIVDFYAVNDLHGKLADGNGHVGVDEFSTFIKNERANKDNVILLSSGDMWQGAAESNLTKGMIITDWMNELDFVSMTIGNHEFDWGQEYIARNAEFAEFPFLAINIYDKSTGNRVDYCDSSVVVEADGIQIGIIGAVGNCYSSISADRSAGVTFKTGLQLTNLVKAEADRLRSEGVDFIVLSIHDGGEDSSDLSYYNTALSNGYVDMVFEAHTHQSYVQKDSYGVYHLQGGGDNTGITHATVQYNTINDTYTVSTAQAMKTSAYSALPDDPVVLQLMEKYSDLVSKANEILGRNSAKRNSNYICDTVAKLYCEAAMEKWGDTYNIVLGGGFLQTRSPYNLAAGNVTYGQLMSLLPFDNRLVLCKIQGSNLKSKFINTTNENYHIAYTDYGNSIKNSISNNVVYYVVVDTYTAYYAANKLTVVEFYEDDVFGRDLLAQYIREGKLN